MKHLILLSLILTCCIAGRSQSVEHAAVVTAPVIQTAAGQSINIVFWADDAVRARTFTLVFRYDPEVVAIHGCWLDATIDVASRITKCEPTGETSFHIEVRSDHSFNVISGTMVNVKMSALAPGTSPIDIWAASFHDGREMMSTIAVDGLIEVNESRPRRY